MIEIGRALVQMRLDTAALRGIAHGGTDVTFVLDTHFSPENVPMPHAILSFSVGASETLAGVPWEAEETISVADVGQDTALDIADRLVNALKGKVWYGESCAIQSHTLRAMSSDSAAGAKNTVTLRWFGRASVRPR